MKHWYGLFVALIFLLTCSIRCLGEEGPDAKAEGPSWLATGILEWSCSIPFITKRVGGVDPDVALKDPSVVFHEGDWHFFGTHRKKSGKVAMQYLAFKNWQEADKADRHTLSFLDSYHCAPQVFFFTPHQKWYLVYQAAGPWHEPGATLPEHFSLAPVYSTTEHLGDPKSWSAPRAMIEDAASQGKKPRWIDFWVICDTEKAHLFYTSDDGHFWRRETPLGSFPFGWSKEVLVLRDTKEELFEASHTYKIKGQDKYLTIIEAMGKGHRYYKAWLADRLEGPWKPLAATKEKPFASVQVNVLPKPDWTSSISHGELIRSRNDETLEIDPNHLQFVFQGVTTESYNQSYGSIPWSIGLLENRSASKASP